MSEPTAETQFPFTLWRNTEFLKFWVGQTISVFGSAITNLALPLTAVVALNASPAQMGFLNAAGMLPFLLVGLFAGAWIDRRRRRPIMLMADLGRALLLGMIPLSLLAGLLRMEFLYVIVFLVGVLTVFFDVSYQAFLPALVSREKLVDGNSKMEISASAAQIAGPGMAGALIQVLSAPYAIAFDAASFLVSAFSLGIIHAREPEPHPRADGATVWKEIGEGLHVVFGNRVLWSIAGCTGTSNFFSNLWGSIFVLYMTRNLGLTPAQIGLIFVVGAPGALLSSLVSTRIVQRVGLGNAIVGAAFFTGVSELLLLLARGPLWVTMGSLILAMLLLGFFNVMYNVNQVSLRQTITPNRLLGRMNASMRFLVWGTIPLGALASSGLSTWLGVYPTIVIGLLGGMLSFLWVFFSPVRQLKEQPQAVEE
jgi:Na+/melibiose symporter-like transporter